MSALPTPLLEQAQDPAEVTAAAWHASKDALRRYLRTRLPSDDDAEDVLQDLFLRLHEGADRLAEADSAEAWAFAVARRASLLLKADPLPKGRRQTRPALDRELPHAAK